MKQLTVQEMITRARADIIIDHPFFGSLLVALRMVENKFIPSLRMDGEKIEYNSKYIERLTVKQLRTIICECILHGALKHVFRLEAREPKRFNKACDYSVANVMRDSNAHALKQDNAQLRDYFDLGELGKFCPQDSKFDNLSAEEIYNKLPVTPQQPQQGGGGKKPGDEEGDQNGKPEPQEGQGEEREPDPSEAMSPGEIKAPKGDKAEREEQEADWDVKVVQAANAAQQQGTLPSLLKRLVDEITTPTVPWRDQLRMFFNVRQRDDFSWKRPKATLISMGIYMPSLDSVKMGPVVVAIDTSGSITDKVLQAFQSELQAISDECMPSQITVIYCDAAVNKVKTYEPGDIIELKSYGGGGTDFRPVFDYIETSDIEPCCLVYLTDCQGVFGDEPSYPVLWGSVIANAIVPYGEMIHVDITE